ncbi:MAG: hypothetical protein ACKO56_09090 [Paracoccaceae bacterium]
MASELLVKRLMMQAGVSVLAGLLMSSAVMAEDTTDPAGDVSVSSIGTDGEDDGSGEVDGGAPDAPSDPSDLGDPPDDGTDGGAIPGDGDTDPSGLPGEDEGEDGTSDGSTDVGSGDDGTDDGSVEITVEVTGVPVADFETDPDAPLAAESGFADNRGTPMGQAGGGNTGKRAAISV